VENIPQRTFIQTLPFKKYTISSEWTQFWYPWGARPGFRGVALSVCWSTKTGLSKNVFKLII
jgi:hypothetical protein